MNVFKYRRINIPMLLFMFFILISFMVIIFSCCSSKKYAIKDIDNASLWLNHTTTPYSSVVKYGIEKIAFSIIPEELKKEYIDRLENMQYIELGKEEYLQLTHKNLERNWGIAIRAVYTQPGGDFFIEKNYKNEYYVQYMAMGSKIWELNKTVLIIEVDELPKEFFIGYTVVK